MSGDYPRFAHSDFQPYVPLATFCPMCPPDESADPRASAALCQEHAETPVGSEDVVVSLGYIHSSSEANGEGGRAIQGLIT